MIEVDVIDRHGVAWGATGPAPTVIKTLLSKVNGF